MRERSAPPRNKTCSAEAERSLLRIFERFPENKDTHHACLLVYVPFAFRRRLFLFVLRKVVKDLLRIIALLLLLREVVVVVTMVALFVRPLLLRLETRETIRATTTMPTEMILTMIP